MRFNFLNIGPLSEVDLEVKPLTIIGGVNQVGKSFITKILYAIFSTNSALNGTKGKMDKLKRIFQEVDLTKLKNRYCDSLGLVVLENSIVFSTASDSEDITQLLTEAGERELGNTSVLITYINILKERGKYREAEQLISKALKLNRNQLLIKSYIELLSDSKKYDEATKIIESEYDDGIMKFDLLGAINLSKYNFDEAIDFYSKALQLIIKQDGEHHIDAARIYYEIACIHDLRREYDKVLDFHFKSLNIREKLLGERHRDTIHSYHKIGRAYIFNNDYANAYKFLNKALRLTIEIFGQNHQDTANSYESIGLLFQYKKDTDNALKFHQLALKIRINLLDENHPDIANSYNNIGQIYNFKKDYKKSIKYHKNALNIRENILKKDPAATANSYNNIGLAYQRNRDYNNAEYYLNKALDLRKEIFGENHREIANSYNNIGILYLFRYKTTLTPNYENAFNYLNKGLELRIEIFGENHPETANSYNNIGMFYHYKNDYDKALEFYRKALGIRKITIGENDPDTIKSLIRIADVYSSTARYDDAIESLINVLNIQKKLFRENHPYILSIYRNISEVYIKSGNNDKALEYLKKINEIPEYSVSEASDNDESLLEEKAEYITTVEKESDKISYISSLAMLDIFRAIVTFRDSGNPGVSDIYGDLIRDLIGTGEPLEEIKLKDISDKIGDIIGGNMKYEMKKGFKFEKGEQEFNMDSVASGIKLFGILQMLIDKNIINPNSYIIFEEPEIHLHPTLRFRLVELIRDLIYKGVYVILTTHSPELIRYVEYMIKTEKLDFDKCSFLNLTFNNDQLTSSGKSRSTKECLEDILLSLTEGYYKLILAEDMEDEEIFNERGI